MKTLVSCLMLLVLVSPLDSQSHPVPPARRELQKYQSTHPEDSPQQLRSQANPGRLQAEAEELAKLADSIPSDVDRISKGMLPKDILEKLKRIEKISKQLRGQLTLAN